MSHSEHVRDRVSSLDERVARLRAEKSRLLARANQAERKRDARRKILIGAAVLAAVQHEGVPALRSSSELVGWLDVKLTRPHDRAVFNLPTP
jgi:large subunit ribosomal protein L7/L12